MAMRKRAKSLLAGWCWWATIVSGPVSAQATAEPTTDKYVGQGKLTDLFRVANANSCIGGHNPYAEGTTARVRGLSEQTLTKYVRMAGAAESFDARPLYSNKKSSLGWGEGRFESKPVSLSLAVNGVGKVLGSVDDPLAHLVASKGLTPETSLKVESFLISGIKTSAMGTWQVIDPAKPDQILGRYRVRFMRENSLGGQAWSLLAVEVFTDPSVAAGVLQYCAEPGDVEREALRQQAEDAERARRKAEKAKARQTP